MPRLFLGVVVAASMVVAMPAPTSAIGTTNDKLAILTFSGPVQVPGATLNAGTYRFRLTNPDTSRNVLQVLSQDGKTVHAMFNTIPDVRTKVTYKDPVVTFMETPAGVPPAAKTLFYSHESIGYSFLYGKGEPNMTPPSVAQPEITYAPAPVAAPVREAEPVVAVAPPVVEQAAAPAAPAPAPVELPRTATPLPWVALGGLASLLAALGLRRRL